MELFFLSSALDTFYNTLLLQYIYFLFHCLNKQKQNIIPIEVLQHKQNQRNIMARYPQVISLSCFQAFFKFEFFYLKRNLFLLVSL